MPASESRRSPEVGRRAPKTYPLPRAAKRLFDVAGFFADARAR
jgi:hypothetical protein